MAIWSSGHLTVTEEWMTGSASYVAGPWRYQRLAERVGRAQDGMHERGAHAVPLAVRPDGQRAERQDGVLADVAPGA